MLHGGREAARQGPFPGRSDDLVEQHDGGEQRHRHAVETPGRIPCRSGQQRRFHEDRRQRRDGGHPEQRGVHERRSEGCQQSRAPAVFVGADEREEVDRQHRGTSQLHEVAQLRQDDIARREQGCREVCTRLPVAGRI